MAKHQVIYCRSRLNPGSALIRLGDGMGAWSHCAGILASGNYVVEALAFKGVVVTSLDDVIKRSSQWHIVDREVPNKLAGDTWALGTVGQGYDYLGALGVPWGRDWQEDGAWFCSEHNEVWQEHAELIRIERDRHRGLGPNMSFRFK